MCTVQCVVCHFHFNFCDWSLLLDDQQTYRTAPMATVTSDIITAVKRMMEGGANKKGPDGVIKGRVRK